MQRMNKTDIMHTLKDVGAILEGHFILSSGLHTDCYIQCALLFQKPALAEKLCRELAARIPPLESGTCVVSPALGGVILGYELARHLGGDALFVERVQGQFALRRSFFIEPGQPCLVAEDVVTTGKSTREAMAVVEQAGGRVVGVACLVNRSGQMCPFAPLPCTSLLEWQLNTYMQDSLPESLARMPAVKPGSRPSCSPV